MVARKTKQVRIWADLDIALLARKQAEVMGVEISLTEAVSLAVHDALLRLEEVDSDTGKETE